MNDLAGVLQRLAADLAGRPFALVGGLAVSVRTEPRFTRDVDVAVVVADDAEAEALVSSLAAAGWQVEATMNQDAANRLAAARVRPPEGTVAGRVADLLFASSGIEAEVVGGAEELEVLPELRCLVASTGHLIALKALSSAEGRPQDEADLVALLGVASEADLRVARQAALLIVDRGYHRGRDLVADIDRRLAG